MEGSPKLAPRSASLDHDDGAAVESGPGELSDDERAAAPTEELSASRRGAASLRARTMNAFEEAHFPPYPADPPAEAPFVLPAGYVDVDAPLTARKWELSQAIAAVAVDLMQRRRRRLDEAPRRPPQPVLHPHQRYSIAEEKVGRMRRPTAIMKSNVEVARLMGMPGSKQRNLSHDDMLQEAEAPQHLSTTRNRKGDASAGAEDHGGANGVAPPKPRAESTGGVAPSPTGASPAGISPGAVPINGKHAADEKPRDRSGGSRSGGGSRPSGGSRHGGTNGHARPAVLPIVQMVPPMLSDHPVVLTNVTTQAVLAALVPTPEEIGGSAPAAPRRVVTGVIVRGSSSSAATPTDSNPHKRKRRPPGWLAGHEQGDEDAVDEEEAEAAAPPVATPSSADRRRGGDSHSKKKIATVNASLCPQNGHVEASNVHVVPCAVAVLGVLPPPSARSRGPMPPPLAPSGSSGTDQRSPKVPRQHGASGGEREKERKHVQRESSRDGKEAVGEDAFQFGDLPSPRMIEVVKAKEIHLPQWRVLGDELIPGALLPSWVPPRRAAEPAKDRRKANSSSSSAAAMSSGGGVADQGDAEDGDASDDEAFERRHVRTLERAIAAARSVAQMLAQKERQKQQASTDDKAKADGDGKPKTDRKLTEEEEWRFRPSELAALCAAQRMGFAESAKPADVSDHTASAGGSTTAGFFGRMGGNSGGRDQKRQEDGEGDATTASGEAPGSAEPVIAEGEGEEDDVLLPEALPVVESNDTFPVEPLDMEVGEADASEPHDELMEGARPMDPVLVDKENEQNGGRVPDGNLATPAAVEPTISNGSEAEQPMESIAPMEVDDA